jgi:hypothetical protein
MNLPAIIKFSLRTNTNFDFHASIQKQKATPIPFGSQARQRCAI